MKNPLSALAALPVQPRSFLLNRSTDPEWVTDGHAIFRRSSAVDTKLLDRIAKVSRPSKLQGERLVDGEMSANLLLKISMMACHDISLAALSSEPVGNSDSGVARFEGSLPGPVLDVNLDLLRLVLAVIGPWDRATTVSWREPIVFWKNGTAAAAIVPFNTSLLLRLKKVYAGKDPRIPAAPAIWKPLWPAWPEGKQNGIEIEDFDAHWRWVSKMLEETALYLGGAPSAIRGYTWAIPTRAGILRVGIQDKSLTGRFDDPLMALSIMGHGQRMFSFPSGNLLPDGRRRMVELFREEFQARNLGLAPEDRPSVASVSEARPTLFGARYEIETRHVPYSNGIGYTVRDQVTGELLRGSFETEQAAADTVKRLSIAATLAKGPR